MNKIFKHVTNAKNGQLVSAVAAETARTTGGSSTVDATSGQGAATATNWLHAAAGLGLKSLTAGILGMMGVLSYAAAPVGVVVHGQASLVTQGSVLNIHQTSQAATVNFQQLNLAKGEGVAVQAQKTSDITLLRVASGMNVNGGFVTANNNLLISSPGGILVSNGGKISAQGEVFMTTQDMAVGQYNKPTAKASTGSLSISGQSVISGSNIVLDAGSINLNQAKVIAAPATAADGIRVQGASISIQSSHLSAPGGKIEVTTDAQGSGINVQNSTLSAEGGKLVIGVDAQGAYAAATTVQGSTLTAQSVQLAGRVLNLDSSNSVAAAHTQIQTVDLLVNADMAKLLSATLQAGSNVVLQGDNSVSMDHDATIAANTAHNTSLSIANTGSQQNNPNAPSSPTSPKPNQVAILGTINLNGGRKSLSVHSAGDLTLDGTRTDVSGDTTFQAVGTIVVNAAHLTTVGDLTIGRDAFGQGALSLHTVVFDSTLKGYNIETSGDTLSTQGVTARTTGGEWLLDPTDITIASVASTGGTLAAALAQSGTTTISTTDIQNAINAGTSVNVVGSGTITLSDALSFANSTANATLTLDNTSGSKQGITLTGGITATGSSATNIVVKSAGGKIAISGTININGDITVSNGYNVGGTNSTFINQYNASDNTATALASTAGTTTGQISAKNINLYGAYNGYLSSGLWLQGNLTATGNINLAGYHSVASASGTNNGSAGIYTKDPISINAGGTFFVDGNVNSTVAGLSGIGVYLWAGTGTTKLSVTANKIQILGSSTNTSVGGDTTATSLNLANGVDFTIRNSNDYITGGEAFSFRSTVVSNSGRGIRVSNGTITNNSNGGDIVFAANGSIETLVPINLAKNTSTVATKVLYDTTTATRTGFINNTGAITVAADSTSAVNLIQKSNGGTITNGGIVNVSGFIDIDNTNGSTTTSTVANNNGATITAAMTAGSLAGTTGIKINSVFSGTGVGISNTAAMTSNAGDIKLTATGATPGGGSGISSTGAINQKVSGGDVILTSNNRISQTGTVTVAANTSGTPSEITYDTSSGNRLSSITTGALNVTGGSSSAVNVQMLSAGSTITVNGAINVPGSINLDNSFGGTAGPGGTAASGFLLKLSNQTSTNTNTTGGVIVNQALTASGSITLKGAALGNGVPDGAGVLIDKSIRAGNGISISGSGGLRSDQTGLGVLVNAGLTATDGDIVIKGQSYNYGIIMKTAQTITAANGSVYIAGSSIVPPSSIFTNHGIEFDAGYRIIANNNIDLVGFVGANATTAYGAMNAIGNNGTYNNLLVAKTGNITLSGGTHQGPVTTTKTAGGIVIGGLAARSAGAFTIQGAVLDSDLWAVPAAGTSANTIGNMNAVNIGNYAVNITGTTYDGAYDGIQAGAGINIAGSGLNASTIVNLNALKLTNTTEDIYISAANAAGGSNIGITTSGAITQNQVGGDISFISNQKIIQTGNVAVVANTSGTVADVLYDTRTGTSGSTIQNGALSVGAGTSTSAINFSELTNGALITNGGVTVPGFILIDNTNGSSSTATIANLNGTTITGALSAGTLAGSTGVKINTVSSGTGVGIQNTAAITALAGPVSLTSISGTANSINLTATSSITSAGGISIIGTSSQAYAAADTAGAYGAVSVLGQITNTGAGGVLVQSTANTATGSITDSGPGGISITGGYNIAAGTVTGGTITAVGTLNNTGGGVISLSMAQPKDNDAASGTSSAPGGSLPLGPLADARVVSITATDSSAAEGTANNTLVFTVAQSNPSARATGIVVRLALGTVDASDIASITYVNAAGATVTTSVSALQSGLALTIPANSDGSAPWSPVFTITVNPDAIYEVREALTMNLALGATNTINATLGTSTAIGTISPGPGGSIEDAAGITTGNATIASNVSYGNVGGVMGAVNAATVNTVNYRNTISGTSITLQVENYSQVYGNSYSGTIANGWLSNSSNVTVSSVTGSSSGFGIASSAPTPTQVLSSLRFAGNLGAAGNSNLVQSGTDLSVLGAITSSYGTVNVTPRSGKNTYTITPKALTITGRTAAKVYDGVSSYANVSAAGTTYSGLVSSIGGVLTGDAVTSLTRVVGTSTAPSTPISGLAVVGSYVNTVSSAVGSGLSNYTITYAPGSFSVTPAALTVTGGNRTTTYNATQQNNATYTVTGLLGNDTLTSVSGVASGTNASTSTYNDSLSGALGTGLSNYTINYVNGALTINKAALNIASAASSSVYTAGAQTGTYAVTGLQGSVDAVTAVTGLASGTNAGTYTSTLGGATGTGLDNYNITYTNTAPFTITKANATLVNTARTAVYNGSAQSNTGAVFTGLLGDDATTITATGYAQATHVAQGAVADNLSATGADSGNYNFTVTNGSLRITPKALSVVGAQTTSVYNTFTQTNTYTTTGLVGGDAISVTGSASARNVSTTNDALGVAFTSGAASNYTTTITDGSLKITPAIISVSGITAANKEYNGTTSATLSGSPTISGVLGGDAVSVNAGSLTGVFDSKNAGSQNVSISGIGLTGADAANYQLSGGTTATTTATITPKTLTVAGTSLTTTYNAANQALAAPTVTGLVAGDNVIVSGNASGTNADTYTATFAIAGTDSGNYALSANAPVLTIGKAALVVTADNNAKFVTQNDPSALTAQVSGFQGSETASSLGLTYTVARQAGQAVAGGSGAGGAYTITPTGASSLTNYTVTYVPGLFTISPAGAVLIKMNPTTSTYGTVVGGTIASVQYVTSTGGSVLRTLTLESGSTDTYIDGAGGKITITPTTTVTPTTGVGTYAGAISNTNNGTATSNGNFTAVETVVNTAVVNQASLTLTLNPVTKTYDASPFSAAGASATATGLMNGQTLASLGPITYSGAAIGAINASATPYALLGSVGSGFANYNVTIAPSSLTITPAPLQITGGTNTFTFNNTQRTNTYAITSGQLYGSDSVTGLTGRAARLHAGATADTLSAATGTGLSNYNISYVNGGLTINPAQLLAVATPTRTPVYNGSTAVPNTTVLTGVIAGTSVSGVTSLALSGAGVGTQTIINNGTLLSGPNSGDYVVLSSNLANTVTNQVTPNLVSSGNGGGTVVITPAPLTITGGTTSHVFNNTTRSNTYSVTSGTLYGSDSVTGVTGSGSGLRANSTATPVYADTLSAATGNGISNYAITYVNGGLTITRAPLTALATPNATTYSGGTSVANTTALSGVIAGTTVAGTTSLVMGSPNAGTQTITNNGTTLSGDFATDYYVVSSNLVGTTPNRVTPTLVSSGNGGGTILVAKAPLSIVGDVTRAVYDGTQQTNNTATVTGAVNGEQITTSGLAVATNVAQGPVSDALVAVAGSGVNLNNYDIAITQGSLEITPATLTVSGITANSKQYDGTTAATLSVSTVSYNGVIPADSSNVSVNTSSLQGVFAYANAGVDKDVLVSGISITGSASSNYRLSGGDSLVVTGTITPAPLTITGGNASHVFNNTTRTNTYSVSGTLYDEDSVTGVTGLGSGLHARTYADNLSAATGNGIDNYNVTYVNGALNITRAPLTALATPLATTYSGGTNVANTTALSGMITGTTVSGITSLALGSPNAGLRNIINNGTTLSGPNGGDYEVVSSNLVGTTPNQVTPILVSSGNGGGTIMVAKAPLTIAGATTQAVFDGTAQTNTATVTGAVNGETITTSGNAVARNVGDVVTDSLQAVAGSGVDLNNYAITFMPGSLEITPAPLVAAPAAPAAPSIEKPADVFILPPTPPVFVAPLDRISDVLANVNGIRLSPANEPAGQPGACSADSAVLFGADSDVLTDEAKEKLRQCCAKNQPMTLSGLRGAEGAGQFNIDLGKRRAQVVRKFMENACQMPQAGHPGKPQ